MVIGRFVVYEMAVNAASDVTTITASCLSKKADRARNSFLALSTRCLSTEHFNAPIVCCTKAIFAVNRTGPCPIGFQMFARRPERLRAWRTLRDLCLHIGVAWCSRGKPFLCSHKTVSTLAHSPVLRDSELHSQLKSFFI